jgi:hypothetical protein
MLQTVIAMIRSCAENRWQYFMSCSMLSGVAKRSDLGIGFSTVLYMIIDSFFCLRVSCTSKIRCPRGKPRGCLHLFLLAHLTLSSSP